MISAVYFQRADRTHITLDEWRSAVLNVHDLRVAQGDNQPNRNWLGYRVNPIGSSPQFHDMRDRLNDAELFIASTNSWFRVFYWHSLEDSQCGVVTFPEPGAGDNQTRDTVLEAARALASILNAELAGEDETWYENQ